jgi:hypothetical protein
VKLIASSKMFCTQDISKHSNYIIKANFWQDFALLFLFVLTVHCCLSREKFFRDAHKLIHISVEVTNDIALTSRTCMVENVAIKMIIQAEDEEERFL